VKKILITGGAGFIGSALVSKLNSEGIECHVVDDLSYGNREFLNIPDDHFHQIDILDQGQLNKTLNSLNPDFIVHLAAIHFIPDCNKYPYKSSKINIQGTKNILDIASALGNVKGVFFASTAAVYPISDVANHEDDTIDPLDIYGLSKITGEYLCEDFHRQSGKKVVIGRFFNAFGPNETNPHLIPEIERQVKSGLRTIQLGNLEPMRDFIHTSDMAEVVFRLIMDQHINKDTFNIGSGMEYSVLEVVKEFEHAIGEKIEIVQDPARIRKVERMHLKADISKVHAQTGWSPKIDLKEGIKLLMHDAKAPGYTLH
jgi:UDP-glucose 4-epimerase